MVSRNSGRPSEYYAVTVQSEGKENPRKSPGPLFPKRVRAGLPSNAPPLSCGLDLCATASCTKHCAGCGPCWSNRFLSASRSFFGKTPAKHAAEPRDCPCRPRAPERLGLGLGLRLGSGLGSGWSGPTCKAEIDDTRPAQSFAQDAAAHSARLSRFPALCNPRAERSPVNLRPLNAYVDLPSKPSPFPYLITLHRFKPFRAVS